jgi:hypothetical protein
VESLSSTTAVRVKIVKFVFSGAFGRTKLIAIHFPRKLAAPKKDKGRGTNWLLTKERYSLKENRGQAFTKVFRCG